VNAGEGDLLDSLRGGNEIPRARCGVVVFHTGDKVGRDRFPVKLFFKLFLISCERPFESGRMLIGIITNRNCCGKGKFAKLPAAKWRGQFPPR
jgi:hypothetical protein